MDGFSNLIFLIASVMAIIAFVRTQALHSMMSQMQDLQNTIEALKHRLRSLEDSAQPPATKTEETQLFSQKSHSVAATPPPIIPPVSASVHPPECMIQQATALETPPEFAPTATTTEVVDKSPDISATQTFPRTSRQKEQSHSGVHKIFDWLTTGNSFAKLGLGLLLLGSAFAVKYFADQGWLSVPIEVKLSALGLLGVALTTIGWNLKEKRPEYAQLLQGGGIAILYLTLFSGYRIFDLYSGGTAFILMLLTTFGAVTIAILQDSFNLAFVAITGGYLVPILTSDGGGSHVALFTYYLILTIGIAGISYFKQWIALTVTGFYFTFIVGVLWGVTQYRPEHFASTEPFLIGFWLLYLIIALTFALRQNPKLNGFVDGTLLFGTPLAAFSLQVVMVQQFEYGIAFSALGASCIYLMSGLFIRSFQRKQLGLMKEALFGISLLFATLSIPFAFSGEVTSAAWALEAAGILWLSHRQDRPLGKLFGMLLQLAAGVLFFTSGLRPEGTYLLNSFSLGVTLIVIAGLFSSYTIRRNEEFSFMLSFWGFCWFYGGIVAQIDALIPYNQQMGYAVITATITTPLWVLLGIKSQWSRFTALFLALPFVILGATVFALISHGSIQDTPGGYTLLIALVVWYLILTLFKKQQPITALHKAMHTQATLFLTVVATIEFLDLLQTFITENPVWGQAAWPLIPIAAFYLLYTIPSKVPYKREQMQVTGSLIVLFTSFWAVVTLFTLKKMTGVPYIPILHPVHLMQIAVITSVLLWAKKYQKEMLRNVLILVQGYLFVWITTIVLQTVATYYDVAYEVDSLYQSAIVQTALSITWTLFGALYIFLGTKLKRRSVWTVGTTILIITIVKILLVDLAASHPLVRIISLFFTGGVIVLIGYFSPMPPVSKGSNA